MLLVAANQPVPKLRGMGRPRSQADLTPEQNARVREAMLRWISGGPGRNKTRLAERLGIKPPSLTAILAAHGTKGASTATAKALAGLLGLDENYFTSNNPGSMKPSTPEGMAVARIQAVRVLLDGELDEAFLSTWTPDLPEGAMPPADVLISQARSDHWNWKRGRGDPHGPHHDAAPGGARGAPRSRVRSKPQAAADETPVSPISSAAKRSRGA